MGKLLIFILKKNKNYNFSLAVGVIKTESESFKETSLASDEKSAVFNLVKSFQEKGISFSEIILNGSENYFSGTLLEPHVSVLKKPELFFPDFIELKCAAAAARKAASGEKCLFSATSGGYDRGEKPRSPVTTGAKEAVCRKKPSTASELTTKQLGDRAETLVANYLVRHGHKIIARNFKTKFYEIDIISIKADKIYFTEVKYRLSEFRGSSLDMITPKKLAQMTFAAKSFLEYRKDLKEKYSPLLAAASVSGENFTLNDWFIIN